MCITWINSCEESTLFYRGSILSVYVKFQENICVAGYSMKKENLTIKGEWTSDIHMISVKGKDQEGLTVKVWANLDNLFLSYGLF